LLIAVQWLARNGGTLQALVIVEVLLGALNNVAVWLWSRSIAKPAWKFEWPIARSILLEGLPLFLTSAFITLYFRIDVFFLDHFRTQAEIGAYAAAVRLTEAMPLIASAVTNSIFPVLVPAGA
jgi:O-antigen/teichoic acid export membrane protein